MDDGMSGWKEGWENGWMEGKVEEWREGWDFGFFLLDSGSHLLHLSIQPVSLPINSLFPL